MSGAPTHDAHQPVLLVGARLLALLHPQALLLPADLALAEPDIDLVALGLVVLEAVVDELVPDVVGPEAVLGLVAQQGLELALLAVEADLLDFLNHLLEQQHGLGVGLDGLGDLERRVEEDGGLGLCERDGEDGLGGVLGGVLGAHGGGGRAGGRRCGGWPHIAALSQPQLGPPIIIRVMHTTRSYR